MKKLQRKQIVAAAVMVFCAACAGVGAVYANDSVMRGKDIAAAIAQKFNLDEVQVQAVFDQQRGQWQEQRQNKAEEMKVNRQQKFADNLAKLVSEGKIIQAQANAINAKRAELEAKIVASANAAKPDLRNMTADERKAAMEARKAQMEDEREALKQWASVNGIPEEYVPMAGLMGGGHGRGGGFGGPGFDGKSPCPSGKN